MEKEMVKVDNVSIRFRLQTDRISSIKETIVALIKGKLKYREFWALNDVSFSVNKGEVMGIVGHNGAGKSTVLKIISGIMKPTKGKVTLGGNVVPMLELGSGFDYDLTGRENVFLNGAILGYSKEFLYSKYDEILAFSELGEFIDQPIRNYSSGMLMRLAFSIATVVNPEILICDEVLAVGDERFQAKSRKRMMELMGGGTTVLFVSHNIDQIREMSNRVVWLDHGRVKMIGEPEEVCAAYREWLNRPEG
ncbi:MAG: ABC transporter ATP-binding protein [Lachnospiraceae bacterium]|nr:ABC transporter ATP-binding protein [Lachnospiraceae bacterium]